MHRVTSKLQGPQEKEAIVQELAESRKQLYSTPRGSAVLRACGVDSYMRSPAEWRQRTASAAAARDEFSRLFGGKRGDAVATGSENRVGSAAEGPDTAEHDEAQRPTKKQRRTESAEAAEADAGDASTAPAAGDATEDASARNKKKRGKAAAAAGGDAAADELRARAAALGGKRTQDMMQLLGAPISIGWCSLFTGAPTRILLYQQQLPLM